MFDQHGWFTSELPEACVAECSQAGAVDDYVEYWRERLNFSVPRELAIRYLREFGAWPVESDEYDQGLQDKTDEQLATIVLWLACCEINEEGEWLGLIH